MANLGDFDFRCGICGESLHDGNHHCDPEYEESVENGRKSRDSHRERHRTFNDRLEDGFVMLELLEQK